jgi:hypothetical protein
MRAPFPCITCIWPAQAIALSENVGLPTVQYSSHLVLPHIHRTASLQVQPKRATSYSRSAATGQEHGPSLPFILPFRSKKVSVLLARWPELHPLTYHLECRAQLLSPVPLRTPGRPLGCTAKAQCPVAPPCSTRAPTEGESPRGPAPRCACSGPPLWQTSAWYQSAASEHAG